MNATAYRLMRRTAGLTVTTAAAIELGKWGLERTPGRCSVLAATGHPCPGCGWSRALTSLTAGEWLSALAYRPFGVAAIMAGGWTVLMAPSSARWQATLGSILLLIGLATLLDWALWSAGVLPWTPE